MIILLSPAKSLDFTRDLDFDELQQPSFSKEASLLATNLRRKSLKYLKGLMNISDALAVINKERYNAFSTPFTAENAKPALGVFTGDVYLGLDAMSMSVEELKFAKAHLRILSGLYGILKPNDLIQPYRLEMGTALPYRGKKNLYQFWGDKITKHINQELGDENDFVVNLASSEYFKSIEPKKLKAPVYSINFKEYKDGNLAFISFNAKRARGIMARWLIKNRITKVEDLYQFNQDRYRLEPSESSAYNLTFTRKFVKAGSSA